MASDLELALGSAVEPTKKQKQKRTLTMHYTWLLTSAKAWCPCGPDALVNMSVFCINLRLEFGWEVIAGLSLASQKQWDMRPPKLYFDQWSLGGLEQSVFGF